MEQFTGLIGIVVLLGIAFALSNNRKKINLRILGWGLGLQMIFAIFIEIAFWRYTFWIS